jgi:hypothetical protein
LFVNKEDLFSDQYKKYLSNQMRAAFGYEGCPIILRAREREQSARRPQIKSGSAPARPPARHARDRSAAGQVRRSRARPPKARR